MQRNTAQGGEATTAATTTPTVAVVANRPGRGGPPTLLPRQFADVLDESIVAADANQTSYAHRVGSNEQTLRRVRHRLNCPSVDKAKAWADRCPALKVRLLVYIAGGDFAIVPVEIPAGTPPADQAQRLRELAEEAQADALRLQRTVTAALKDGRVDAAGEAAIVADAQAAARKPSLVAAAASALRRLMVNRRA